MASSDQRYKLKLVKALLHTMKTDEIQEIKDYTTKLLSYDIISILSETGHLHLVEKIFTGINPKSLFQCERVSRTWRDIICKSHIWKHSLKKLLSIDDTFLQLSIKRNWNQYVVDNNIYSQSFYKNLYCNYLVDKKLLHNNWKIGRAVVKKIDCEGRNFQGVYCVEFDEKNIIAALRDRTVKVWDKQTLEIKKTFSGHTGSVLCFKLYDSFLCTGSSDNTVRIWDYQTCECVNILKKHDDAVLQVKFHRQILFTSSKDHYIIVWRFETPLDITPIRVIHSHRSAVNAIEVDDRYIISASGDRTLKIWNRNTLDLVHTLMGHKRGITCMQYSYPYVVTGSSDKRLRVWSLHSFQCIAVLNGHADLVRCVIFDSDRIVSGCYDGSIIVWSSPGDCSTSLQPRHVILHKHSEKIFKIFANKCEMASSSFDDTIILWDFTSPELSDSSFWSPNHDLVGASCRPIDLNLLQISVNKSNKGSQHFGVRSFLLPPNGIMTSTFN